MRAFCLLLTLAALPGRRALAQTPALAPEPAVLVGTYRLSYQPDSTDPARRSDIFYLLLGKTLSKFQSRGEQAADSLLTVADAVPFNHENAQLMLDKVRLLPRSLAHYTVYKTPGHLYFDDRIGTTHYRYEEPAGALSWTITPATATVAGYACQRATASFGGRTWEAWFTRAVPIPDGPYKFYGLPGLIVKVADTRQQYVFELTQLRQLAPPVAIAPPKVGARLLPKADFVRSKADYDRTAFTQMLANGNFRFNTPEDAEKARLKAQERATRKTNPLELR